MKPQTPFPSGGGDWRYDVKSGQLVDASQSPAPPAPAPAAAPSTPPARTGKRAKS